MNPEQTSFDPGLTQQYTGKILRTIEKDGSFNVRKSGGGFKNFHFFHFLINVSWPSFFLVILAGYFTVNAIFASLYLIAGIQSIQGANGSTPLSAFMSAFFLSVHTFTTVGYGTLAPKDFWTNVIAAFEALTGLMALAVATGLLYGRFSRPSARLAFSEKAIVAPYRNGKGLQFRVANKRPNVLMDLEATVMLMTVVNSGGTLKREYFPLSLERSTVYFLALTWTLVHPIDESSPFYGKSTDDLRNQQAEILILIKGFDDTFSQVVHSRYSYTFDEIEWGAKFRPAFRVTDKGDMVLDLDRLSEMELLNQ
jgi:inward rectifier potassium channel